MSLFWQQTIVAAFIVACAIHLAWRGWQTVRGGKTGCASCNSCPKPGVKNASSMVTLDTLEKSARRKL